MFYRAQRVLLFKNGHFREDRPPFDCLFSHVRVQNRRMIDFKGLRDCRNPSQFRPHFDFAKLPGTWSPGPDRDRASIALPAEKSPSPCTYKKRVLKPQDKNLLGKKIHKTATRSRSEPGRTYSQPARAYVLLLPPASFIS